MGKSPDVLLEKKESEMLEMVGELKLIQCELNNLKRFLEIKSESLRGMVKDYKKLQANFQMEALDKNMKIGKHLEFYDYPKLVFKVDGIDIFTKSDSVKEGLFKEGCELKEAQEEKCQNKHRE
jgi:hypothetical protein